jgi:hypothetical protein
LARQSEVSYLILSDRFKNAEAEFVNKKEITKVPGPGHAMPDDKYTSKFKAASSFSICKTDKHPQRR